MKAHKLIRWIQKVLVLVLLPGLALSAFGQVESGRLLLDTFPMCRVAGCSHAVVKATNAGTNIAQTVLTDSAGDFVITPAAAGAGSLSETAPGFESINAANIEVQVGQIVREDLQLKIGEATTTIQVYTDVPLLEHRYGDAWNRCDHQKQLTSLPLEMDAASTNLLSFYARSSIAVGYRKLAGDSTRDRGRKYHQRYSWKRDFLFLLDGVDVSEQHQGGTFIQTSIDALQEFSVQQSSTVFSAEYNRGGAFFNAT